MKKIIITGMVAATLTGFVSTKAAEAAKPNQISVSVPYVYAVKENNCYLLGSMLRDIKSTYKRVDEGKMNLQSLLEELTAGEWMKYSTLIQHKLASEQTEEGSKEKPTSEQTEEGSKEKPTSEQTEEAPTENPASEQTEEVPTENPAPEQEVKILEQEVEKTESEDVEEIEEIEETEAIEETEDVQKVENAGELTQEEQQMVDLVNQARMKEGLSPLKADVELTKVARAKSQDMITGNYFDHNSPTYGSPFEMMTNFGIQYLSAAENIAGNQTVEAAHNALMNSSGHYANIMGNFTEIGIGIIDGGPYEKMFTQMFKQ